MERARILFVDDDRGVRTAFARTLRNQDYDVDLADGLEEAIALASQHHYAVIASDYRMPGANEFLEHLFHNPLHVHT